MHPWPKFAIEPQVETLNFTCRLIMQKVNMGYLHSKCFPPRMLYFLFKLSCLPLKIFEYQMIDVRSSHVEKLHVTWRKFVCFLSDLPHTSNSDLLSLICNDINVSHHNYMPDLLNSFLHWSVPKAKLSACEVILLLWAVDQLFPTMLLACQVNFIVPKRTSGSHFTDRSCFTYFPSYFSYLEVII